MAATKTGQTICTLDDLTFPVEMRDNPRRTNREYSKVVTGTLLRDVPMEMDDIMALSQDEVILLHETLKLNPDYHPTKKVGCEVDLNYCSPVYQLVPNSDIFPRVERILKAKGIKFTAQYSHTQNTRFYGNFIIEDPRFAYIMDGTTDMIKFIWNFQHSYNGLTKYRGVAGFYRVICTNGLVVPIEEMNDYNLVIQGKHTASILHSLKEFSSIMENVTDNLGQVKTSIVQKYELLGGRWVSKVEDRVIEVLKANKITPVENSKFNTVNDILDRIEKESNAKSGLGYNGKVNDWLIYNGINQYLNDDDRNIASPEKRRETDSKVFEYMLQYA